MSGNNDKLYVDKPIWIKKSWFEILKMATLTSQPNNGTLGIWCIDICFIKG